MEHETEHEHREREREWDGNDRRSSSAGASTITVKEALSAIVILITMIGSGISAYYTMGTKLTEQDIKFNLTDAQLSKDLERMKLEMLQLQVTVSTLEKKHDVDVKDLSNQLRDFDNSLTQIYQRISNAKQK
jgi:tRNA U34 5-carboxymethylaminomethyl modifying enzyme MnmG/GidA